MPKTKNLSYANGTCFLVPLRSGGFGRGVVARNNGKGLLFAYFFGPRVSMPPSPGLDDLQAQNAILVGKVGDLGFLEGKWPIIGEITDWNPAAWPMPGLVRVDEIAEKAWLSFYDDRTFRFLRENVIDVTQARLHFYDGTMGYGAAEIQLTKLIDAQERKS